MNELVIIIWTILAAVFGFLTLYMLKQQKRKMGKYMMFYLLILLVVLFLTGMTTYWLGYPSVNLIWIDRLNFLVLGTLAAYALYFRSWPKRSSESRKDDSVWPELTFTAGLGCLVSIIYVSAPQIIQVVPFSEDLSVELWDLPILYLFPIVCFKVFDFAGHVPFWTLENPFIFTIEQEDIRKWPRRDLIQINFRIKKSLNEEHNLFTWYSKPWIEAPKKVELGRIFRLMIQQRRHRSDVETIQDMGDEYDGMPSFWWAFKIKFQLLKPSTWSKTKTFLNPDLSLKENGIQNGDLIIATRVPGEGKKIDTDYGQTEDDDLGKTVIVNR